MRPLLYLTLASVVLYHVAAVTAAIRGSFGSLESYGYGLLMFVGPFAILVLAAAVGLSQDGCFFFALLSGVVLVLLGIGLVSGPGIAMPAFMLLFGTLNAVVLLCTCLFRGIAFIASRLAQK